MNINSLSLGSILRLSMEQTTVQRSTCYTFWGKKKRCHYVVCTFTIPLHSSLPGGREKIIQHLTGESRDSRLCLPGISNHVCKFTRIWYNYHNVESNRNSACKCMQIPRRHRCGLSYWQTDFCPRRESTLWTLTHGRTSWKS